MPTVSINAEAVSVREAMSLDPATIAMLIEAIVAALKAIQDCRQKQNMRWVDVKTHCQHPLQQRRLKKLIQRRVGEFGLAKLGGDQLVNELLARLKSRKVTELQTLCDEAESRG